MFAVMVEQMVRQREDIVIRASEIGQYLYCARGWWLHWVRGFEPANVQELIRGQAHHAAHGRGVFIYRVLRWLGYILLVMAFVIGLALVYLVSKGI